MLRDKKKTGKEETVNCDVCCVMLDGGAGTECGKPYKHSLSNKTKTRIAWSGIEANSDKVLRFLNDLEGTTSGRPSSMFSI